MSDHRFTKTATDYASGALVLVRSRIREHKERTGRPPYVMVLHVPTARKLFSEFATEKGLPAVPPDRIRGGITGQFEGTRLCVCLCGDDLGEDQLVDWLGNVEPL